MVDEKPPCTCGGRGICTMCQLEALEAEEEEILERSLKEWGSGR